MESERTTWRRGFTLVELMVALTGGLIFSIFVFMMTRDVSRFFRQEAGLSDATSALLTGYQRLRADVQRAGFLASPNFIKDLARCPSRSPITGVPSLGLLAGAGWDAFPLIRTMALARLTTPTATTWQSARSLSPDELVLYGNYTTADTYPVRSYGGGVLFLNPNSEELVRSGYAAGATTTTLARIFPVGTMVRVLSANTGEEQYAVVAGTGAADINSPTVTLNSALPLQAKGATFNCGIRGIGADLLVNPVNIIRYRLGSLSTDTAYAALYGGTGGSAGAEANWTRYDLLREELSPSATAAAPISQELVAEFAVDFRVGAQVVTDPANSPATTFYAEGNALIPSYLGESTAPPANQVNFGPHLVRALRPRLAIRTRAPDRQANVVGASGLYRVPLTTGTGGGGPSDYARVRTLQSLIMMHNSKNKVWE